MMFQYTYVFQSIPGSKATQKKEKIIKISENLKKKLFLLLLLLLLDYLQKNNKSFQKHKQELCSPLSIAKQSKMKPMLIHIYRILFNLVYTVNDNDFPL